MFFEMTTDERPNNNCAARVKIDKSACDCCQLLISTSGMADVFTKKKRSSVMSAIRSTGNRDTELKLLKIMKDHGIRGWRRNLRIPGRPDFCFPRTKLAVFVDGCFWHGCPMHGRKPTSNIEYWHSKLEKNQARDLAVNQLLRNKGWRVLRIWEHDLKISRRLARKIERALKISKKS
jgi:DNA mismatch endonuclease (patch repair protein)